MNTQQILIIDNNEMSGMILYYMFNEDFDTLQALDGQDAISQIKSNPDIVLIFLNTDMPTTDTFGVLDYMSEHNLLKKIPVILTTSKTIDDSNVERAYAYEVADIIKRPLYDQIVKRRSRDIIELYQNRNNMEKRLAEQEQALLEQQKEVNENNEITLNALCSIIESKSPQPGSHTKHIQYYTGLLLNHMAEHFPEYGLTPQQIDLIAQASVLHDIGNIGIPEAILQKPGKLTNKELQLMKTHTTIGCDILEQAYKNRESAFKHYCCEICHYHHERWDGSGYPDHLSGDEIPLSAQIVGIADAYDTLIRPGKNKTSYNCKEAFEMILTGKCGQFSPDILKCFKLAQKELANIWQVISMFNFS